jgi:hypothetical protein
MRAKMKATNRISALDAIFPEEPIKALIYLLPENEKDFEMSTLRGN